MLLNGSFPKTFKANNQYNMYLIHKIKQHIKIHFKYSGILKKNSIYEDKNIRMDAFMKCTCISCLLILGKAANCTYKGTSFKMKGRPLFKKYLEYSKYKCI